MLTAAQFVIMKCGGLTKTAKALSSDERRVPVTTVQAWRDRNRIPPDYWQELIDIAEAGGETITLEDFLKEHDEESAVA